MPNYQAPLDDMRFLLHDVFALDEHLQNTPAFQEFTPDLMDTVLEEAAKINQNLLFPLNQPGDQQGCRYDNGTVTTPDGFREAYQTFVEAGWPALTADPNYGGQGLPHMVGCLFEEMMCSSNLSFGLYSGLTTGVCRAIGAHASDELKQRYLPNMISGQWTGVMCLTEPHCGTDLSLIRTKAEPQEDGSYQLSGTKIFITAGEHDLSDNIVHLVLAKVPGGPAGVKGISLFLVPKFMVNDKGELGNRNPVHCASIEHKMGIKGSCTCVMNYDQATGFLVGELHQGLKAMFTVMNIERLAIGLQGLGQAEISYQNAALYAQERLQGRSPTGPAYPDKAADPIIVHPDVRRMLLTMRCQNEAARALTVWLSRYIDQSHLAEDQATRTHANDMVALFTPVVKTFFTDYGFEACNLGMQVLGGHGYISEWGMEQYARDARIAQIYEGANGIQALDLVKRKLVANQGASINLFIKEVETFIENNQHDTLNEMQQDLANLLTSLQQVSQWILNNHTEDKALVGSSSYQFCHLLALTAFAYMWYQMTYHACQKKDGDFLNNKIAGMNFFREWILPKTDSLLKMIYAGSKSLMAMSDEQF